MKSSHNLQVEKSMSTRFLLDHVLAKRADQTIALSHVFMIGIYLISLSCLQVDNRIRYKATASAGSGSERPIESAEMAVFGKA